MFRVGDGALLLGQTHFLPDRPLNEMGATSMEPGFFDVVAGVFMLVRAFLLADNSRPLIHTV